MTEMTLTLENDALIPTIERMLSTVKGIVSIKTRRSRRPTKKVVLPKGKTDAATEAFFKEVFGKSTDSRTADEIIADIYSSRINKDESFLEQAFDS